MTTTFDHALDRAVTDYLRTELPEPMTRPERPCLGGVGTVVPHALRSPLLTTRLRASGIAEWTTAAHPGVDELADDPSWHLAMVLSPHKLDAARRCHALTPAAAATGVVDTMRRTAGGTIYGCNTNATAAAVAVSMLVGDRPPRRILVAGTGASSRSVLAGLRERFPESAIGLWGRSSEKAVGAAERFPGTGAVTDPGCWEADVVVNATTVGETEGELPEDFPLLHALTPGVRFFDLNNRAGPLQQAAVSAGCVVIAGVMMQLVTNALRVALLTGAPARRLAELGQG